MISKHILFSEILLPLSICSLIIIVGLLLNGYIVTLNFFWWMKHQTLHTIDVLVTSLGLVRLIHLFLYVEYIIFSISGWSLFQVYYLEYIETVMILVDFCGLWWGSMLCVFYCVKITNYSNRFFVRLKMNISKLVPWMLLVSLLISVLSSLPYRLVIQRINGTVYGKSTMEIEVNLFIVFFIFSGSIIPFLIFCASIYLIIVSLLRHTRYMSNRNSGFSDAQRDIHISVIRCMISFLVLYTVHLVAYINTPMVVFLNIYVFNIINLIFMCAYPSLHSISLIVCNKKLKKSFFVVFSCNWLGNSKQENP
ncbi:taste receptor type 2 member 1-like [Anomaloglossus baeobatrachus]|uniref:taste receptor type 2 member 1-like n=1 Tax=Anomaloglossus baeobatrachus TaxID=238106 RepID=UPI003F4FF871